MPKNNNSSYSKGKRWGFAVAKNSIATGKNGVYKVDKAMRTCSQIALTGKKQFNQTFNQSEREAYRGAADGMYDALRAAERKSR